MDESKKHRFFEDFLEQKKTICSGHTDSAHLEQAVKEHVCKRRKNNSERDWCLLVLVYHEAVDEASSCSPALLCSCCLGLGMDVDIAALLLVQFSVAANQRK